MAEKIIKKEYEVKTQINVFNEDNSNTTEFNKVLEALGEGVYLNEVFTGELVYVFRGGVAQFNIDQYSPASRVESVVLAGLERDVIETHQNLKTMLRLTPIKKSRRITG